MSVKVMGMVFDSYPTGGGEMLLALSLADFADDEGGRVFPSVPTLARKTRQSERSVQYQLRKMEQVGFISIVERSRGGLVRGKKYKSNEYRINIGFLINGAKTAPLEQRCNPAQSTVQSSAINGATAIAPNPSYNPSLYPPPLPCPHHEETAATNHVQVVVESDELDELVEAAVWAERGKIHKEAGFRRTVRTRILSCGPNPEDMQNLDGKPASLYEMIDSPFLERIVEQTFQSHVPRLRRHHALDDARVNRLAWLAWNDAKKNAPQQVQRFIG